MPMGHGTFIDYLSNIRPMSNLVLPQLWYNMFSQVIVQ